LNAVNSLSQIAILSSYWLSIGCLVWRRLYGKPLPDHRWDLGRWGLPINITALLFVSFFFFFATWPLIHPVTASNM